RQSFQLASQVAVANVRFAVLELQSEAHAELAAEQRLAHVGIAGETAGVSVKERDLTQRFVGWASLYEVERAGGIRGAIDRAGESVQHFEALELLHLIGGVRRVHAVHARVRDHTALEAARLRSTGGATAKLREVHGREVFHRLGEVR